MTLNEAIEECQRYLAYIQHTKEKSEKIQETARVARLGDQKRVRRMMERIDSNPVVYDGARLCQAIPILIREIEER